MREHDDFDDDRERRRQKRLRALGTNTPRCASCGEDDPRCLERHHIEGQAYGATLAIVCRNCHRKGKRQNYLSDEHIEKIIDTYKERPEKVERYARCVTMGEIEANDFNLNISRYVSKVEKEVEIDLAATHQELVEIEEQIREATAKHNVFLQELGLSPLPGADAASTTRSE
jgi:hypothetical protein